jgi:hypothetical protein
VPGEEVTVPGEEVTAPGEEVTAPGEVTVPGEEVTAPGEEVTAPGGAAAVPSAEVTVPGEEVTAPGGAVTASPRKPGLAACASMIARRPGSWMAATPIAAWYTRMSASRSAPKAAGSSSLNPGHGSLWLALVRTPVSLGQAGCGRRAQGRHSVGPTG